MRRTVVPLLGIVTVLALILGPVVYAFHEEKQMRNFRVVSDGVLYRSARMTLPGLRRAIHDYGIRTIISLRDADTYDRAEEAFCNKEEIAFFRLPPRHWDTSNGRAEAQDNVDEYLRIIGDPDNYPILVHCFAGIHRTGAYIAIYRMEHEKWSNEDAIAELKALGYEHLDDELDVLGYLEQYRPTWRESAEPPAAGSDKGKPNSRKRLTIRKP